MQHQELTFDTIVALRFLVSLHRFTNATLDAAGSSGRARLRRSASGRGRATLRRSAAFRRANRLLAAYLDRLLRAHGEVVVVEHRIAAGKNYARIVVNTVAYKNQSDHWHASFVSYSFHCIRYHYRC